MREKTRKSAGFFPCLLYKRSSWFHLHLLFITQMKNHILLQALRLGVTLLLALICQLAFAQNEKRELVSALSKKEILKMDKESSPVFQFDSVQVELFFNGERFAILPAYLKQQVDDKYIVSTELTADTLSGHKTLLRIQLHMRFRNERK